MDGFPIYWPACFMAGTWRIWKARNEACFSQIPFYSVDIYRYTFLFANNMRLNLETLHSFHLDLVNGCWFRPPPGCYKLNVDGSTRANSNTYGGLLHNYEGE